MVNIMNDKIFDTKTKLITHNTKGIATLTWEWGSLVKLLKSVLVDGSEEFDISGFEYDRDKKELKILVSNTDGILPNTVLKLSGHSDSRINKEFRVSYARYNYVVLNAKEDLTGVASSAIKGKVSPLGWNLALNEIDTTGTAVFKNTGSEQEASLRVVDKKPEHTSYNENWARFARITGGKTLAKDGSFKESKNFPCDQNKPDDAWLLGDKQTGPQGIYGWTRWYYCVAKALGENIKDEGDISSTKNFYPAKWFIVGDQDTFYLGVMINGNDAFGYCIYSFGLYEDYGTGKDTYLICTDSYQRANEVGSHTSTSALSPNNTAFTSLATLNLNENRGAYLYSNEFGAYDKGTKQFSLFTVYYDENTRRNPQNAVGQSINPLTGKIFTSPLFVRQETPNKAIRGKLYGVYCPIGYNLSENNTFLEDFVSFKTFMYSQRDYSKVVEYLFSLKDWK